MRPTPCPTSRFYPSFRIELEPLEPLFENMRMLDEEVESLEAIDEELWQDVTKTIDNSARWMANLVGDTLTCCLYGLLLMDNLE